jgi:copper homeostasis protein
MKPENLQYEVCVDSASGARVAQEGGAHRVELCGALSVGGITPSAGAIRATRELVEIDVHVLIRPRAGDFHFDAAEIDTMRRDIEMAGEWGAKGVVIGALTNDGRVAVETCRQLIEAAASMSVTFHRAFDVTEDAASALGALIALGCDRVLSSGQAASAWAGRELLPGAGIDETNAGDLVRETGVRELHFSATSDVAIASIGGRGVAMGSDTSADRVRGVTDVERVRRIISASVR